MACSRTRDGLVRSLTVACALSLGAGCAGSSMKLAPPRPDRPWIPETTKEGEIRAGEPPKHDVPEQSTSYDLPRNERLAEPIPRTVVDAGHAYSLAELIDIAQSNNPLTRVAWNVARDAALAVGIARSSYLPRLTAAAVGGFRSAEGNQTVSTDTGIPGVGTVSGGTADRDNSTGIIASIGLQWMLFDFGERSALLDASKQIAVASNVTFTAAHQQVAYGVTVAFYTHATAVRRVAMVERALANAKDVEEAAQLRLQQGQGTSVDVAQARQATAQAALRAVQARGAAQSTYFDLLLKMGISPTARLRVEEVPIRPMSATLMDLTDTAIRDAVGRRPDVLAAYANAKAAEATVGAARAAFYPKIFASGNVAYSTGGLNVTTIPAVGQELPTVNLSGHHFSGTILAGVAIPIWDGGVRSALLAQSHNRVDSANAVLKHAREEAIQQIVSADTALRTSLALLSAATALEEASTTTFDAALASYRSGVGTVTVATMAESGLLDARIARGDAFSAVQIAAASLAFATGSVATSP